MNWVKNTTPTTKARDLGWKISIAMGRLIEGWSLQNDLYSYLILRELPQDSHETSLFMFFFPEKNIIRKISILTEVQQIPWCFFLQGLLWLDQEKSPFNGARSNFRSLTRSNLAGDVWPIWKADWCEQKMRSDEGRDVFFFLGKLVILHKNVLCIYFIYLFFFGNKG